MNTLEHTHIASFIIHARPLCLNSVTNQLSQLPAAECVVEDAETGKLVVLLEAASSADLNSQISSLRDFPGVLSLNMVFHQIERSDFLTQELVQ